MPVNSFSQKKDIKQGVSDKVIIIICLFFVGNVTVNRNILNRSPACSTTTRNEDTSISYTHPVGIRFHPPLLRPTMKACWRIIKYCFSSGGVNILSGVYLQWPPLTFTWLLPNKNSRKTTCGAGGGQNREFIIQLKLFYSSTKTIHSASKPCISQPIRQKKNGFKTIYILKICILSIIK